MYKTGILNSEISKLLSDLGHTDQIIIADCGLPVPQGVKKIDLALEFGKPTFLDVFHLIKKHMVIESITIADEMISDNRVIYSQLVAESINITTKSHHDLKTHSENVKAVIRTGEATPYANAILTSGVLF
ncbi:D-ribose pyranase [Staphylococcus caeli]|uniref:D-ribose pyranase n=1 Tax=Staphylococcus caeli TaxID=2201815 RepID=UPI003F544AF1